MTLPEVVFQVETAAEGKDSLGRVEQPQTGAKGGEAESKKEPLFPEMGADVGQLMADEDLHRTAGKKGAIVLNAVCHQSGLLGQFSLKGGRSREVGTGELNQRLVGGFSGPIRTSGSGF